MLGGLVLLSSLVDISSAHAASARPSIKGIYPSNGSTAGGTAVIIRGRNFSPDAQVPFGGVAASLSNVTPTSISAITPAHTAGAVEVTVVSNGIFRSRRNGFSDRKSQNHWK